MPTSTSTSTLTLKAKLIPTSQQAEVLRDAMFCATKVYNGILYQLREEAKKAFETTGQWPKTNLSDHHLNTLMKSCPRRHAMHSDTASQVWRTLRANYHSFFALKKNGHVQHSAPSFKRKDSLSTLVFPRCNTPKAACFIRKKSKKRGQYKYSIELRFGKNRLDGLSKLVLPMFLPPHRYLPFNRIRQVEILYDTNVGFKAHLSFDVDVIPLKGESGESGENQVALDLGEKHIFAAHFSDGSELLVRGGKLRAIRRYWQKVRSKVKPPSPQKPQLSRMSRRYKEIALKESRQIEHALHIVSKQFIELCVSKGVTQIALGDLKGIRDSIDYGRHANQRLHAWTFSKLTFFISYKAALRGISVKQVDEAYTSRTCSKCRQCKESSVNGRWFNCPNPKCGFGCHRDVNGVRNIFLKAFCQNQNVSADESSSGGLALPAVLWSWIITPHTVCKPAISSVD